MTAAGGQRRLPELPRRRMLQAITVAGAAMPLASCGFFDTNPDSGDTGDSNGGAMENQQAPELAELVEAGELPPLAERLPENPLVIEPHGGIGRYGGLWNIGTEILHRTVGYDYLVRWNLEWTDVIPNLAEEFEFTEDATEYTFYLRRGVKWSDGAEFTAEDIRFAVEDWMKHPDNDPSQQGVAWMRDSGGRGPTVEAVDDYTVVFRFENGHGLFLELMCHPLFPHQLFSLPKHYMSEFHTDYNDDIDSLFAEEDVDSWSELFERKGDRWGNIDLPTLNAWRVAAIDAATGVTRVERNPYYWKVDSNGNQLPYLDAVEDTPNVEPSTLLTNALAGDIQYASRDVNRIQNKPVFAENADSCNCEIVDAPQSEMNAAVVSLNLTHPDEALREVFNNKDFRIGLSHAIDRESMNEVIYAGQGEIWQAAPHADSPWYDEEFATQYTEYDVDLANQHLDDAGYAERNGDGWRLGPDGAPITFEIPYTTDLYSEWADVADLIRQNWADVGVNVRTRVVDITLLNEMILANDYDSSLWAGDGGLYYDIYVDPRYYVPINNVQSRYAPAWAQWYNSNGEQGQEPPERVREALSLYDEVKAIRDRDRQDELMGQIMQIAKEEFFAIGTLNVRGATFSVVTNDFRNVPKDHLQQGWIYANPGPFAPEQFYLQAT